MKTKFEKFIDAFSIFFAIALFVIVLALCVFGIKLSLEQLDNKCVAYADSTDGVVEDNILIFDDFSSSNYNFSWDSSTFVSVVQPLVDNQGINAGQGVGSLNGNQFTRTGGSTSLVLAYNLFNILQTNTNYVWTVRFTEVVGSFVIAIRYGNNTFASTLNISSAGVYSLSFLNTYSGQVSLHIRLNQGNASCTFEWFKLEEGSSFTGYVPKDYENYGYNQGLEDGYEVGLLNQIPQPYKYISPFTARWFGGDAPLTFSGADLYFDFQGRQFGINQFDVSMLATSQTYQNICYASYVPSSSTAQPRYYGLRFMDPDYDGITGQSVDWYYGDILITFPYMYRDSRSDIVFCFEDTITGDLTYITSRDTAHWFWGDILGSSYYMTGASSSTYKPVYRCQVQFFTVNPVNIYVFNDTIQSTNHTDPADVWYFQPHSLALPLNCSWANIYATQQIEPSSYSQGVIDGKNSVDTQSYYDNGFRLGRERGRIEGAAAANDFSFLSLIGAVFDAPIQAFSGLLDFNILGVNLKSFVLALLSLSVIIIIIKIALGGGS